MRVTRVATPDGDVAMKTFGQHEVERAEREAAVLRHLPSDARYRVQSLVGLTRSETGAVLTTRWLHGRKKVYTEIDAAEWHALGATLAALHERLDTFAGPLPAMPATVDVPSAESEIEALRKRAPAFGRYLDARLALLHAHAPEAERRAPGPSAPIHNDYNQHNYLFDDVSPPIVLDWDRAVVAPREYEVVRCLNHLPLVAPEHARAFVSGYRAVRALDVETLRWAVARTLVEHAKKSWPLERALDGAPGADAMLRGSMEVLHALHERSDRLAAFFEAR